MTNPGQSKIRDLFGKLTIKEPYRKTRWLSLRFRAYVDLLRPFTLLPPLIISMFIIVASIIYYNKPLPDNWLITVVHASGTIAIVNAASNTLNQATDVAADKVSKPHRPIPLGIVKVDEAQSLAYILYLFALLRSATINPWFGFFIFMIMVFTVTYSLPPRMKQYLFINQVWIAIPRGMLGILASWSVFGDNPLDATPLIIGSIATVFLIGGMATKDISDAEADRRTGTRTLINTYGRRKAALMCFPFMFFPFIFIAMFLDNGLDPYLWPLIFVVILTFPVIYLMIRSKESQTLENVPAWSIMYVQYMIFAMGFALLTIFSNELPL